MIYSLVVGRGAKKSGFPIAGAPLESYSWDEISAISNAGKAQEYFTLGDRKDIVINGVRYDVLIVGFDHDDKSDGTGKAGITFTMEKTTTDQYQMNSTNTNIGGWESCLFRTQAIPTILNQMTEDFRKNLIAVNKSTTLGNKSEELGITSDKIWLFSASEIGFSSEIEEGKAYAGYSKFLKKIKSENSWLRSPYISLTNTFKAAYIYSDNTIGRAASNFYPIFLGFCI